MTFPESKKSIITHRGKIENKAPQHYESSNKSMSVIQSEPIPAPEMKLTKAEIKAEKEQVKPAHAKKLISEAFSKDTESKDIGSLQRLFVKLKDEETKALSIGVDTTGKAFTEQGFIIHNLSDAINHVLEIKKKKEQAKKEKPPEPVCIGMKSEEKRWVYGTRTNKWHMVGSGDRDYKHGISQSRMKKIGRREAKKEYLQASLVEASSD